MSRLVPVCVDFHEIDSLRCGKAASAHDLCLPPPFVVHFNGSVSGSSPLATLILKACSSLFAFNYIPTGPSPERSRPVSTGTQALDALRPLNCLEYLSHANTRLNKRTHAPSTRNIQLLSWRPGHAACAHVRVGCSSPGDSDRYVLAVSRLCVAKLLYG